MLGARVGEKTGVWERLEGERLEIGNTGECRQILLISFAEKSGQRNRIFAGRQCGIKRGFILKFGKNYICMLTDIMQERRIRISKVLEEMRGS